MRSIRSILLPMALGYCLATSSAAQEYRVQEVKGSNGASGTARALNANGEVAGTFGSIHGASKRVFRAAAGRAPQVLVADDAAEAAGIDIAGNIAGSRNLPRGLQAFLWHPDGTSQALVPLGGDQASAALGMSGNGTVVGWSSGAKGVRAVRWNRAGAVQQLDATDSEAYAVNGDNVAVGLIRIDGSEQAVLWSADRRELLGVLPNQRSSRALAINDRGEVVGTSSGANGTQAFIWDAVNGMRGLGSLSESDYSAAFAINNSQNVVGSTNGSLGPRAFLWSPGTGMRDLNSLVPTESGIVLTSAVAINDRGQILAVGTVREDPSRDRMVELDHAPHAGTMNVFLLTLVR